MNRFQTAITMTFIVACAPSELHADVDFAHNIVPILKKHCVECHGGDESNGGFSINTRSLFLESEAATPGSASDSYFVELIRSKDPDTMMPPPDHPRLSATEISTLQTWVDEGLNWQSGFTFGDPIYEPPLLPRNPELPPAINGRTHPVDRLLDQYSSDRSLEPLHRLDDSMFFRRVNLDLVGLLPNASEVRNFLRDDSPSKRTELIDQLLSRKIAYTEHWLTFWNDLLRNDYAGTGFITGGRTQISDWLYESLKSNKPYDVMVRELISPAGDDSSGFINGIKWRGTVSAGQTLPIQFSQSVSQSFLGINLKCASCHDSFIDNWTLKDAYGLAAIYSDAPLELHRCDKPTGQMASPAWLFPEIGQVDPSLPKQERLRKLADLMVHPENGRLARTIVNRLWAQLMGRGIVHPLDAMQTEPWNSDLLDWLAYDFQVNGYDLKHTLSVIATSEAYQSRSAVVGSAEEPADFVFDGPRAKRMTAEQFRDAVWQATHTAPAAFHAPVVRGVVAPELAQRLSFPSSWVWGPSVDEGLPSHGETILLRRDFKPQKSVRSAGVIAAADNAYVLYLNNRKLISGERWTDLQAATVTNNVQQGKNNRLLMFAENRGSKPNAAGAFCAIRLEYDDGTDQILVTDDQWKVSETVPKGSGADRWNVDVKSLTWESARPLPNATWKSKTDARIGPQLAKVSVGSFQMVRSSLLKADPLMSSLGRPNRDQIVTSRPSELTTLEAVGLSTNAALMEELRSGAEKLVAENANATTEQFIEELYLTFLTRAPTSTEKELLLPMIGQTPDVETVTDVLWSLTMTPEFFIIR